MQGLVYEFGEEVDEERAEQEASAEPKERLALQKKREQEEACAISIKTEVRAAHARASRVNPRSNRRSQRCVPRPPCPLHRADTRSCPQTASPATAPPTRSR
jgi:hypothetical protein